MRCDVTLFERMNEWSRDFRIPCSKHIEPSSGFLFRVSYLHRTGDSRQEPKIPLDVFSPSIFLFERRKKLKWMILLCEWGRLFHCGFREYSVRVPVLLCTHARIIYADKGSSCQAKKKKVIQKSKAGKWGIFTLCSQEQKESSSNVLDTTPSKAGNSTFRLPILQG